MYTKYVKPYKYNSINPEIRLMGKWLEKWGFKCGNEIIVRNINKGIIIIKGNGDLPPTIFI